jgi:hypothetical protein
VGIAALWIASFESRFGQSSRDHPPVAERLFNCFDRLNLRQDSGAAELIAHSTKAWLDPQGQWSAKPFATSREFFTEAVVRLHRHMTNFGS